MDCADIVPYISLLEENIEELCEALSPLLTGSLSETAGKLPLLDKAQFYVMWTYAIESVLFSYLRLNAVDAKDHPVFVELSRVKQYFSKIKAAECATLTPNTQLDKAAADRFIKHALDGNRQKTSSGVAKPPVSHNTVQEKPNSQSLRKRERFEDFASPSGSQDSVHNSHQVNKKARIEVQK